MKELTTTLQKLNFNWPQLSSVTLPIEEYFYNDGPHHCYCSTCSIDSVITGMSDETLKSIKQTIDVVGNTEPECVRTSILFEMKNLKSLTLVVPYCHLFSKDGPKNNVTMASVNTLKKLPNLKVSLLVELFREGHHCWDVYKLYEEFRKEFEPFSEHILVNTFPTENFIWCIHTSRRIDDVAHLLIF